MKKALILALVAVSMATAQNSIKVQIRTQSGAKVVDLPLERYVAAVLAGESSIFQSPEALKAMAVAARTYAVRLRGRHSVEGFDFCDTTHCQRIELDGIGARLESAAAETTGELLWYQGKPAFTPYTRDCGGHTEDAAAIWPDLAEPYLKSREDPYCARRGSSSWQWSSDPRRILQAVARFGSPRSCRSGSHFHPGPYGFGPSVDVVARRPKRVNAHQCGFLPLRGGSRARMEHFA